MSDIVYAYQDPEVNVFFDRFVGLENEFDIRLVWVFDSRENFIELTVR